MKDSYAHDPWVRPIETSTAVFERTVLLRDANVRSVLTLLEEDLMIVLREYAVGGLVEDQVNKVLRSYDSSI